jgi:hypothetical protein
MYLFATSGHELSNLKKNPKKLVEFLYYLKHKNRNEGEFIPLFPCIICSSIHL